MTDDGRLRARDVLRVTASVWSRGILGWLPLALLVGVPLAAPFVLPVLESGKLPDAGNSWFLFFAFATTATSMPLSGLYASPIWEGRRPARSLRPARSTLAGWARALGASLLPGGASLLLAAGAWIAGGWIRRAPAFPANIVFVLMFFAYVAILARWWTDAAVAAVEGRPPGASQRTRRGEDSSALYSVIVVLALTGNLLLVLFRLLCRTVWTAGIRTPPGTSDTAVLEMGRWVSFAGSMTLTFVVWPSVAGVACAVCWARMRERREGHPDLPRVFD